MDVKQALRDSRFRDSLPSNFSEDISKYLQNPSCACNLPIYKKIINEAKQELLKYFPGKELPNIEEFKIPNNNWSVINCSANELESRLAKLLPNGRKQIAVARYEDQVTVVVNDLDII